jgi:hypothetical protein
MGIRELDFEDMRARMEDNGMNLKPTRDGLRFVDHPGTFPKPQEFVALGHPKSEPIEMEFSGHVPSKKNSYTPKRGGMFKSKDLQDAIDRLAMQVPGEFRDLKLVSPQIEYFFTYTKANWDRDNAAVTLGDILVQMGVLANDNIASCNGPIVIHPAVRGDYDSCRIVITPR